MLNLAMGVQFCCSEIEQAGHVSFGLRNYDPPDIEGKRELQPIELQWTPYRKGIWGPPVFPMGLRDCQRSFDCLLRSRKNVDFELFRSQHRKHFLGVLYRPAP
jgi:hypothetical protein